MTLERLDIVVDVSVLASELDDLATDLLEVAGAQRLVDESMRIDIDVDDSELDALVGKLAGAEAADALGGGVSAGTPMTSGGGTATADGGGGRGFLSRTQLRMAESVLGNAFNPSALLGPGGRPRALADVVEIEDIVDTEGMWDAMRLGNLPMNTPTRLRSGNLTESFGALADLQDMGLADLPQRRGLGDRLRRLNLSMTDFYDLLAAMLPLIGTFVGALPAVIAGVVALGGAALAAAAGLAAVAGLGALGFAAQQAGGIGQVGMDDLTEAFSGVADDFLEAFGPIAQQLAPLFENGLNGLSRLFDAIAARGDTLLQLRDDARAFGGFILDTVPAALNEIGEFADAAGPLLGIVANALASTNWAEELAKVLTDIAPEMFQLFGLIASMIPGIINLSKGFLIATNTILMFIGALATVASWIPLINNEMLGAMIGLLLGVVTATLLATKAMGILSTVTGFYAGTVIASAIASIGSLVASFSAWAAAALGAAAATHTLTLALQSLLATTGIGLLLVGLSALTSQFASLGGNISGATKELERFSRAQGRFGGSGFAGEAASSPYANYVDNSTTTIEATDRETGSAVAAYSDYKKGTSRDSYFSN